jgi:hypothetical protein
MSLTQYAARLLALRSEFRASNRATAFLLEVLRSAASAALVLSLMDLIPLFSLALSPGSRLAAIAAFAVIMPVIEEIRLRLIGPHASA